MKATLFSANLKTPRAISLESLAELIKDSSKAKHIIALPGRIVLYNARNNRQTG